MTKPVRRDDPAPAPFGSDESPPAALLEPLLRILGIMASSEPLEIQLGRIHEQLWTVLDASNLFVAIHDAASGLYFFPYNADPDDQDFAPQALTRSLTDYVRRTGRPLLCTEDVHRSLCEAGDVEQVGLPAPVWLGAPLVGERGCFGVVVVQSYVDANALSASDVPAFAWVARCMGVAVERQWRAEQLRAEQDLRLRELVTSRDQAVRASEAKSRFLQNMSHELRTPLTAILGYTDLLLDEHPALAGDLGAVRTAAVHLCSLIDDILDLTQLEAGHLQVERAPVVVAEVLAAVEARARPWAEARRNVLVVRGGPEAGRVTTDRRLVLEVLSNLVANACKFTEDGHVAVRVRRVREGDDREVLVLEVSDTGIGIDPAVLPRLFEPFTQADDSATRVHGGSGLGLALARGFVGLLGGRLDAVSVPGRGSTFTVRLPVD